MKRIIRFSLALGEGAVMQVLFASPVSAQTATPSSESTASALPEAGTFPLTVLIAVFGIVLLTVAASVFMRLRAEAT